MKRINIICVILLFFHVNIIQAKQRELSKGTAVVFGVDVLLRSIPSEKGGVVDVMPIASKIEIIDKASLLTTIGDVSDYWYKIKYNDEEGFIWGALIADYYFEKDFDADGSVETVLILNLTKGINDEDFKAANSRLEFRVARNGQLIYEHKRQTNYSFVCDTIAFETLPHFTPELKVIRIKYDFNGEIKGSANEFHTIKNNNLDSLFTVITNEGEGGTVCYSSVVFPNDKGGKPNIVIINTKCADVTNCDDAQGKPCNWEYSHEELVWNGKNIIEKGK